MPTPQSSTHTIKLDNQDFTYTIRRSSRSWNVRLTIHPTRGLIVSAPKLYPQFFINRFLSEKQSWILTHLKSQELRRAQQPAFQFQPGNQLTLLGTDYQIIIQDTQDIRPRVILDAPNLVIATPLAHPKNAEKFFHTWLDRFVIKTITDRVDFYATQNNLSYHKITIKNQQSLWGSCSAKQNLNFSKRLIQLPMEMIDYVVCHELAHLTHMNHSPKFWNQVALYFPNYKRVRRHMRLYRPNITLD